MVGLSHFAHSRLGFCAVLSAQQRFHHARILGASFQSAMRRVPGGYLHHCLHLHEDFGAALCRQRGSGACCGLVAMEDRRGSGHCHRHLYRCRRFGRGHLYGHRADSDPDYRRRRPYCHRTRTRRRSRTSAHDGAARLLPHDQAGVGCKFSMDRHLFRRAYFGHLVLVYGPSHRSARALRAGRGPCQSGHDFRRFSENTAGLHACPAGHHCFRAFPGAGEKARFRVSHSRPKPSAGRPRRLGDGCAARRSDGRDEFGVQFCFHACHAGFLQEDSSASVRKAACKFRPGCHWHDGSPGLALGSFHWLHQQPAIHLSAERAGLYQPTDLRVLHSWNTLAPA